MGDGRCPDDLRRNVFLNDLLQGVQMSGRVAGRQVRRLLLREMLTVGTKWVAMERKMGARLD